MTAKHSDTVYEYKKVHPIKEEDWDDPSYEKSNLVGTHRVRLVKNKIDELCIEQNHLMKDFELYKKAFKQFVTEMREK